MNLLIAGIHTGIGKTLCSTILCEALGYDYWKPVQAGHLDTSDSTFVQSHLTNSKCTLHNEAFKLKTPISPHQAAALEGIEITLDKLSIPLSSNSIVIETAGGLMSPLGRDFTNIDWIEQLRLPIILVSNYYLGSINHTLLSIEVMQKRNIKILGLILNGEEVPSSKSFIMSYASLPLICSIPHMKQLNKEIIKKISRSINLPSS